jgi:4-hydroxybenzoate polyprenyltransferase
MLLAVVLARNTAMGFNRFADRKIDAANPRTASREIPSGKIRPSHALIFVTVNALLFMLTAFFINPLCFFLSPVALSVVAGYSYTKRFTSLSHLVLGLGLALAPMGAYLAVTAVFELYMILFSLAVMFWVAGFDVIYALQDEDFDKIKNLNSIPARLGKKRALFVSSVFHVFTVLLLVAAGILNTSGWLYFSGLTLFSTLLVYQHLIISPQDIRRVNAAFFTANGLASLLFMLFCLADIYF